MAINLTKGQRVDLTKGNTGLSKVLVGLGWDEAPQKKSSGLLGSFFGGSKPDNIDCDASVLMLDENKKLQSRKNVVYFGNLQSTCGSINHSGDNLTGAGEGDDEQIIVTLNQVPPHIHRLLFVVNIYDCVNRKQDFGLIQNAFIRVANFGNNQELVRYNLTDNFAGKTALIVGEIYRHQGEWKFAAIGEGTNDTTISKIIQNYT